MAEAVEELFEGLKSCPFENQRKLEPNKISSLEIQEFGNARRFRLKTAFSGVLQHPRLIRDHSDDVLARRVVGGLRAFEV